MRSLKIGGLAVLAILTLVSTLLAGDTRIRLETKLAGPAIGGVEPGGEADFSAVHRADGMVRLRLSVGVEDVNYPDGTKLAVKIEGEIVGYIVLYGGAGELDLDSEAGHMVPYVKKGDIVKVFFGMNKILAGCFMKKD